MNSTGNMSNDVANGILKAVLVILLVVCGLGVMAYGVKSYIEQPPATPAPDWNP